MAQRLDQRLLDRGRPGRVLLREGELLPRQLGGRRRHQREIDVRAAGEGDAPMRHGARGIDPRRLLKRADRRAMIEAKKKPQALVEIFPGLGGLGGDRVAVGAEPIIQWLGGGEEERGDERGNENERSNNAG